MVLVLAKNVTADNFEDNEKNNKREITKNDSNIFLLFRNELIQSI